MSNVILNSSGSPVKKIIRIIVTLSHTLNQCSSLPNREVVYLRLFQSKLKSHTWGTVFTVNKSWSAVLSRCRWHENTFFLVILLIWISTLSSKLPTKIFPKRTYTVLYNTMYWWRPGLDSWVKNQITQIGDFSNCIFYGGFNKE